MHINFIAYVASYIYNMHQSLAGLCQAKILCHCSLINATINVFPAHLHNQHLEYLLCYVLVTRFSCAGVVDEGDILTGEVELKRNQYAIDQTLADILCTLTDCCVEQLKCKTALKSKISTCALTAYTCVPEVDTHETY